MTINRSTIFRFIFDEGFCDSNKNQLLHSSHCLVITIKEPINRVTLILLGLRLNVLVQAPRSWCQEENKPPPVDCVAQQTMRRAVMPVVDPEKCRNPRRSLPKEHAPWTCLHGMQTRRGPLALPWGTWLSAQSIAKAQKSNIEDILHPTVYFTARVETTDISCKWGYNVCHGIHNKELLLFAVHTKKNLWKSWLSIYR